MDMFREFFAKKNRTNSVLLIISLILILFAFYLEGTISTWSECDEPIQNEYCFELKKVEE